MSVWGLLGILLAQERLRTVGGVFRSQRGSFDLKDLLMIALVMASVGGLAWWLTKKYSKPDKRRAYTDPPGLFRDLCASHRLSRPEQALLKQMAEWYNLGYSAQLFLEPGFFDPKHLGPELGTQATLVKSLAKQLFTESDGQTNGPTGKA